MLGRPITPARTPRLRVWLAVLLAAVVASACAGGSSGGGGTKGPSGGAETGQLLVWDWDSSAPGFAASFKQIDANFEKAHPGVTIKRVTQPFGDYAELFQATLTAGSGPCVAEFLAASSGPGVLRYKTSLVQLNSMITADMRKNLLGLDVASDKFNANGASYGIPYGLQPTVMYYNKKLFTKAGLDPDNPPRSYADLVAAAKKLKGAGIMPFAGGNKESGTTEWWFSWLWPGVATKQDSYDLAEGKMAFTDPKVATTLSRFTDLVRAGYFPPGSASTPLATSADDFGNGKAAMFVGLGGGGFASYVSFDKSLGAQNVGVMEANGGDSSAPHFLAGGPASTWGIPRYCKLQKLASEYVKYITGPEATDVLYRVGGVLPGWKSVQLPANAPSQPAQMVKDFRSSDSLYDEHGLWPADVEADFLKQTQLVIGGQQSVPAALANVAKTAGQPGH